MQPAPWAAGDPNHNILFDWSEFTYNDAGLWLNSSQVDMFAVPHAVTVTGATGATKRTGDVVANGRNAIIDGDPGAVGLGEHGLHPRPTAPCCACSRPARRPAPGCSAPRTWTRTSPRRGTRTPTKTLTVVPFADQPNTRYFGRTVGNVMNFTNTAGQQVASFNRPTSADVWGCDGDLRAPNDLVVGPIARTLCAALNRGTLGTIDTQPSTNAAQFYQNSPTNQYAKIIHANMVDGKAYAFAFDDVGAFESLVHDGDPRSAGIMLSPFGGGRPAGRPARRRGSSATGTTSASTCRTGTSSTASGCIDVELPRRHRTRSGRSTGGTLRSAEQQVHGRGVGLDRQRRGGPALHVQRQRARSSSC